MKKSTLLKVARAMLERAGILFATTGNNAVNLAELVPDVAERRALALAIATWEGTAAKYNPKDKFELGLDWVLMRFASAMLGKHIQGAETLEAAARGEVTLSVSPDAIRRPLEAFRSGLEDLERQAAALMLDTQVDVAKLDELGKIPPLQYGAPTGLHREISDEELRRRVATYRPTIPAAAAAPDPMTQGTVYPAPDSAHEDPPFDVETHAVEPGSMLSSVHAFPGPAFDVETHAIAGTAIEPAITISVSAESAAEIQMHADIAKISENRESIEERPDGWYWFDETWSPNGPHATRELAVEGQNAYCEWLMGERPDPGADK